MGVGYVRQRFGSKAFSVELGGKDLSGSDAPKIEVRFDCGLFFNWKFAHNERNLLSDFGTLAVSKSVSIVAKSLVRCDVVA